MTPVSEGGVEDVANDDAASLRRQLAEARANLRLIEEREAEYVLGTDVPLQLVKENLDPTTSVCATMAANSTSAMRRSGSSGFKPIPSVSRARCRVLLPDNRTRNSPQTLRPRGFGRAVPVRQVR